MVLGIIALLLLFIPLLVAQYIVEVPWLPSSGTMPVADLVIDLFFFSSIVVLLTNRFKLKGVIIIGVPTYLFFVCLEIYEGVTADGLIGLISIAIIGIYTFVIVKTNIQARAKRDILILNLQKTHKELEKTHETLKNTLAEVKTIKGLIPICASCKKIRNDKGFYESVEHYIKEHSNADFTHGICEECAKKLYPDIDLGSKP
jgi:hypothetical protein